MALAIVTKNAGAQLAACLASIRHQTLDRTQYEIVVVDGASTDDTVDVLANHDDVVDRWLSESDDGVAEAWNKALEMVTANWILFLGADDMLADNDVLRRIHPYLKGAADIDVLYGRVLLRGGRWNGLVVGSERSVHKLRYRMAVPHQGAFHNVRIYKTVGHYDLRYGIAADYELLLRLDRRRFRYVPELITIMNDGGLSSRYVLRSLREAMRAQMLHGTLLGPVAAAAYVAMATRHCWRQLRGFQFAASD